MGSDLILTETNEQCWLLNNFCGELCPLAVLERTTKSLRLKNLSTHWVSQWNLIRCKFVSLLNNHFARKPKFLLLSCNHPCCKSYFSFCKKTSIIHLVIFVSTVLNARHSIFDFRITFPLLSYLDFIHAQFCCWSVLLLKIKRIACNLNSMEYLFRAGIWIWNVVFLVQVLYREPIRLHQSIISNWKFNRLLI